MTAQDIRNLCDRIHDVLNMAEHPPAGNGGAGTASQSRPPIPVAVLDAKVHLKQVLASWALLISEDGQFVIDADDDSMSIAAWIHQKADWLANHPAADDFLDELDTAVRTLAAPYRGRDHRIFCGIHAGMKVFAKPGQKTVMLPDGRAEQVKTLREEMLVKLLDHIDTASVVASILREYYGMKITVKKIHTTHNDDKRRRRPGGLEVAAMDGKAKLFRVGDVQRRFGRVNAGKPELRAVS